MRNESKFRAPQDPQGLVQQHWTHAPPHRHAAGDSRDRLKFRRLPRHSEMRERERTKSHSESTYEAPSLAGSAKSCNPKCVGWPQNVEGGSAQEVRGPELTTGGPQERNTNRHARRRSSRCGFTHFLSHSSGASLPRSRVERTENNRSESPSQGAPRSPDPERAEWPSGIFTSKSRDTSRR